MSLQLQASTLQRHWPMELRTSGYLMARMARMARMLEWLEWINATVIESNPADFSQFPKDDTREQLETMSSDRDALRDEVTKLREALARVQTTHQEELTAAQERLEESQNEKEEAETQYQTLLGKVGTIKAQLGERLKADAVSQSWPRRELYPY